VCYGPGVWIVFPRCYPLAGHLRSIRPGRCVDALHVARARARTSTCRLDTMRRHRVRCDEGRSPHCSQAQPDVRIRLGGASCSARAWKQGVPFRSTRSAMGYEHRQELSFSPAARQGRLAGILHGPFRSVHPPGLRLVSVGLCCPGVASRSSSRAAG